MTKGVISVAILGALISAMVWALAYTNGGPSHFYHGDDAAENRAMDRARSTLSHFSSALANSETLRADLLAITDVPSRKLEWFIRCEFRDEVSFTCRDPGGDVDEAGKLTKVIVNEEQIVDWSYFDKNGRINGSYTPRLIFDLDDPTVRSVVDALFLPLPK